MDTWSALPSQNAPAAGTSAVRQACVVSTCADMFVWLPEGRVEYDQVTGEWYDSYASQARRYDNQGQQWSIVADACNPFATHPDGGQSGASLVVADGAAIVWGGNGQSTGYRLTMD